MTTLAWRGIHPQPIFRSLVFTAAICLIAACKTTQVSDVEPVGGFLPQPALLQPGESGQMALVYLSPQVSAGGYHKIILDPVMIWAGVGSNLLSVPAEQQQALVENFHAHVYDAISKECQVVTDVGPNTVRIR